MHTHTHHSHKHTHIYMYIYIIYIHTCAYVHTRTHARTHARTHHTTPHHTTPHHTTPHHTTPHHTTPHHILTRSSGRNCSRAHEYKYKHTKPTVSGFIYHITTSYPLAKLTMSEQGISYLGRRNLHMNSLVQTLKH